MKVAATGSGSSSVSEFSYRESLTLKFPLPEDNMASSSSAVPLHQTLCGSSDNSLFPLLVTCPQLLVFSVHEKTFFSEKKLGEVELNLADIHEDK